MAYLAYEALHELGALLVRQQGLLSSSRLWMTRHPHFADGGLIVRAETDHLAVPM